MAAAEYYHGSIPNHPPQQQGPRPTARPVARPAPASHPYLAPLPYPISDAPPPYSQISNDGRAHSQPPPSRRTSTNCFPSAQLPPQQNGGYFPENTTNYLPTGQRQPMYTAQDFRPHPTQYPPRLPQQPLQQQGYPFPAPGQPAMGQVYGASASADGRRPSTTTPGYAPPYSPYRYDDDDRKQSRSRSRSRSHSRHGKHHHHHQHRKDSHSGERNPQRKKSTGVSTFLGAGGGALIGDAIFPGLGTIGGAILGGLGGHSYDKQLKSYDDDARRGRHSMVADRRERQ